MHNQFIYVASRGRLIWFLKEEEKFEALDLWPQQRISKKVHHLDAIFLKQTIKLLLIFTALLQ